MGVTTDRGTIDRCTMSSAIRSMLRILLISMVAASPLLAGLGAASAQESATAVVGSSGPCPRGGSRQDDPGTVTEESGEDEADPDDVRVELGWLASAADAGADVPGRFSPAFQRVLGPVRGHRAAFSRGPPTGR